MEELTSAFGFGDLWSRPGLAGATARWWRWHHGHPPGAPRWAGTCGGAARRGDARRGARGADRRSGLAGFPAAWTALEVAEPILAEHEAGVEARGRRRIVVPDGHLPETTAADAPVLVLWTGYRAGPWAVRSLRRAGHRVVAAHDAGRGSGGRSAAAPRPSGIRRRTPIPRVRGGRRGDLPS